MKNNRMFYQPHKKGQKAHQDDMWDKKAKETNVETAFEQETDSCCL